MRKDPSDRPLGHPVQGLPDLAEPDVGDDDSVDDCCVVAGNDGGDDVQRYCY